MDFEVKNTGERRTRPQRVKLSYKEYDVNDTPKYMGGDMFQDRHRLEMTIATDFWSNSAQLPVKVEQAKKVARSHIFKDMLPLVEEIMLDSTDDIVIRLAGELKKLMIEGKSQ